MEAEQYGTGGEIGVIATREEWQAVIDQLLRSFREPEGAPAELIHWLINQGVYED